MIHVSRNLYRGPRPKEGLADLQSKGVKVLLDLEYSFYEAFHNDKYEEDKKRAADFGIKVINVYCSDITPPNLKRILLVLRTIKEAIDRGEIVYIHCLHGKDRTGFMVACYRIVFDGWTPKQAIKEMFSYGFHKWPYIWWVPFLYRFDLEIEGYKI